ncbi:MAG TPA: hypothetical protein PKB00_14445 [Microthrixaceae bacterium]|nr:hypothetical protein [Microthrixaceae bacterium]
MAKSSDNSNRIDDRGRGGHDDPTDHDIGDDRGGDRPDDVSDDDPTTHDIGDDHGGDRPDGVSDDDPATHDIGDDHGGDRPDGVSDDDPATHDVGDDHGGDRPAGVSDDDPATHDVGDDHGGDRLQLVLNERTGQWIFTDDATEHQHWLDDHGRHGGEVRLSAPGAADDSLVSVWRFHDPVSGVYYWTADAKQKDDLVASHPEIEFEGEAFKAFGDDSSGGRVAIGVVWDQDAGRYGSFTYLPVDDAIKLAGQSDSDDLVFMGVSFYI